MEVDETGKKTGMCIIEEKPKLASMAKLVFYIA